MQQDTHENGHKGNSHVSLGQANQQRKTFLSQQSTSDLRKATCTRQMSREATYSNEKKENVGEQTSENRAGRCVQLLSHN